MKKSLILSSGIVLSAFLFTGCATIISGDNQNINLQSKKEQTVSIDGKQYTSPGIVALERTDKDAILKVRDCNKQILLKEIFNNILAPQKDGLIKNLKNNNISLDIVNIIEFLKKNNKIKLLGENKSAK